MSEHRPRIVSLVPSSTETLLALDAEVVACTRFCERPELPHVGGTKNPDLAAIVELEPDLVVVDQEENRREDHDALVADGIQVLSTQVTSIESALQVVVDLARAAGVEPPPTSTLLSRHGGPRRTAFVPIWRRPWMTVGPDTYGASLLDHLGIELVPRSAEPYPTVELADVAAAGPDLVLAPSEPYVFRDDHLDEISRAVPDAEIRRIDGQDLFWWGVRTPGAISRLAGALGQRPTA